MTDEVKARALLMLHGAMIAHAGELQRILAKPVDDLEDALLAWGQPVHAMHRLIDSAVAEVSETSRASS